jgi:phage FluMu protein Com
MPKHLQTSPRAAVPVPDLSVRQSEWRCTRCDKLLGVCRDGRMHLRFARGHEYLVGFPVQATCRGCGTLNQATAPAR